MEKGPTKCHPSPTTTDTGLLKPAGRGWNHSRCFSLPTCCPRLHPTSDSALPKLRSSASFCTLSLVKDLLDGLPPRRLAGLAALGAGDHGLLELVRHLPPLAHLGVLAHPLHVARVVVADVFEGREEDVRLVVVEYAVCGGDCIKGLGCQQLSVGGG